MTRPNHTFLATYEKHAGMETREEFIEAASEQQAYTIAASRLDKGTEFLRGVLRMEDA